MTPKIFVVVGTIFSFLSLTYSAVLYLEMRNMEVVVKAQDYGDDVVVDKLNKISANKSSELGLFLSEIRNRGKQLSLLRDGMNKAASRAKFFSEVEIVLWLISTCVFSVLLIRTKE